ncbi:unnamed protein product [Prunus armeniaca]
MMASRAPRRAVGINAKSSATHATTIGWLRNLGCPSWCGRRASRARKNCRGSGSAFNATPGQAGVTR